MAKPTAQKTHRPNSRRGSGIYSPPPPLPTPQQSLRDPYLDVSPVPLPAVPGRPASQQLHCTTPKGAVEHVVILPRTQRTGAWKAAPGAVAGHGPRDYNSQKPPCLPALAPLLCPSPRTVGVVVPWGVQCPSLRALAGCVAAWGKGAGTLTPINIFILNTYIHICTQKQVFFVYSKGKMGSCLPFFFFLILVCWEGKGKRSENTIVSKYCQITCKIRWEKLKRSHTLIS